MNDLNISALMVANQSSVLERDSSWLSITFRRGELTEITRYLVLHRWEMDSRTPGLHPLRGMKELLGTAELVSSTPEGFTESSYSLSSQGHPVIPS